jgi:hypothetical protein
MACNGSPSSGLVEVMPRFFIDTVTPLKTVTDDVGLEYRDFDAARRETLALLPVIARDELPDCEQCEFTATLRDADGTPVYQAKLTVEGWRLT